MSNLSIHDSICSHRRTVITLTNELFDIADAFKTTGNTHMSKRLSVIAESIMESTNDLKDTFNQSVHDEYDENIARTGQLLEALVNKKV